MEKNEKRIFYACSCNCSALCISCLHKENKTHYTTPDVPAVKINDISKIKIVKGKKEVSLEKDDDNWVVT